MFPNAVAPSTRTPQGQTVPCGHRQTLNRISCKRWGWARVRLSTKQVPHRTPLAKQLESLPTKFVRVFAAACTSVNGRLEDQLSNSKRSTAKPATKVAQANAKPPVQRQTNGAATGVQCALAVAAEKGLPTKSVTTPDTAATPPLTQQACAISVYLRQIEPVKSESGDHGDLVSWAPFHAATLLSWWVARPQVRNRRSKH